jgi:hypothetical protein
MPLLLVAAFLAAPLPQAKPVAPPSKWSTDGQVEAELRYNTNLWLLDSAHKDRLERGLPADKTSGRYDDMETAEDLILRPSVRVDLKGPSPLGRKVDFWAGLGYDLYFQNSKRNNLDLALGLEQGVGSRGRFELEFDFLPQYFNKNYLADGVDASGNGNISSDERIYEPGEYREWEVRLGYRHALVDAKAGDRFGLDGHVQGGLRDRAYDDPFSGRDEEGTWVKLGLQSHHWLGAGGKGKATSLRFGLHYRYETVNSPTESEVVLLDEVAFGTDFSGDGDSTDSHARVVTTVDRSRVEHEIRVSAALGITAATDVGLAYAYTIRDWSSDEPLDADHRDRKDNRNEVELFVKHDFAKGWQARAGVEWREQQTDRGGDPGASGESFDYSRSVWSISVDYRW